MSQDYKYTAADFERYHSGKMTEAEMHALEKAALEDPFLADALEGYAYTDSPAKDITDIKDRLSGKRNKKKVFFIISKQNTWLRIAALFVLIAGIGYVVYLLNFNKEDQMLATKQAKELNNAVQSETTNPDSSLTTEKKDVVANIPITKKNEGFFKAEDKLKSHDMIISGDELKESSSGNPVLKSLQKPVTSNPQREVSYMRDKNVMQDKNIILKGKVEDSTGNPVSYAAISARGKNLTTTSDSAGRFQLSANDSSLTATVSASGYKTKEKKLTDKSEQVIVIENENKALNEVAITAPALQRQKKEASSNLESKVPGVGVTKSTAEPVDGLQKFTEYVKKNIRIPVDTEGKSYKGNVVLSFEINKNGNPKQIKVAQSFCKPCNKEAIRLLKHGPKWKYINNNIQYVAIEF